MTLLPTDYNENYYNGRNTGIRVAWGYSDIIETGKPHRFDEGQESLPYNARIKEQLDKLAGINLSALSVLDVGGAVGNYSQYGKRLGVGSWTVLDYNIDGWCEANKLPTVDTFITGDAKTVLPTMRKNEYDVIFTSQFLECIDDTDLPNLITEMNRVSKVKQIHLVSTNLNDPLSKEKYNLKTLSQWASMGFEAGTLLIDFFTLDSLAV